MAPSVRERLLRSIARAVADKGYDAVTIADLTGAAGVSRASFYQEFADKEECLHAAYDALIDGLVGLVADSFAERGTWPEQVRRALDKLLGALAAEPAVARMLVVEVPAAGPDARDRYRAAMQRFLPFFEQGREYVAENDQLPHDVALMALGGAEAIIFDEVVGGRAERLRAMLPEILFAILVPYLGPEVAAEEMGRASKRG